MECRGALVVRKADIVCRQSSEEKINAGPASQTELDFPVFDHERCGVVSVIDFRRLVE